jgi:hypothetical protein
MVSEGDLVIPKPNVSENSQEQIPFSFPSYSPYIRTNFENCLLLKASNCTISIHIVFPDFDLTSAPAFQAIVGEVGLVGPLLRQVSQFLVPTLDQNGFITKKKK